MESLGRLCFVFEQLQQLVELCGFIVETRIADCDWELLLSLMIRARIFYYYLLFSSVSSCLPLPNAIALIPCNCIDFASGLLHYLPCDCLRIDHYVHTHCDVRIYRECSMKKYNRKNRYSRIKQQKRI